MTNIIKGLILFLIVCGFKSSIVSQSIVNTEKLFKKQKWFALSSKIGGNVISGNANIFLMKFDLNTGYFKEKWNLKFISGGQNLLQDGNNINSSLFAQIRCNYFICEKSRLVSFFQHNQIIFYYSIDVFLRDWDIGVI